jgi:asparagine synthase (glutamine-hydrolysing)
MCGICGAIQLRGTPRAPLSSATLRSMTATMTHRGPNDEGYHIADGVAIGVRRLSIVDVVGGHQPMANEHGTIVAAQNGEVYNHDELRRELESAGRRFRTTCDTEVLPHLYDRHGDAVADRLNGMFAFVIWDEAQRRALLARDRLGIKPLYFAEAGDLLIFGSELKTVLASGIVPLDVDVEALDLYLSLGFVPGPRTMLRHVKKLLPGHRIVVEPPGYRIEQYWEYPAGTQTVDQSDATWEEQFLELLDDSVRRQLMSDVPLGAMLSGGLDSSMIVALMARRMDRPVKTFAVGFAGTPDNELSTASKVASALGAEHHELELSLDDPVDLEELAWTLDEPVADLSSVGFAALASLTAEHVTVALSGQGADELLAGYDRYRQTALVDRWTSAPKPIRRAAAHLAKRAPQRLRLAADIATAPDPIAAGVAARSEWHTSARRRAARGDLLSVDESLLGRTLAAKTGNSPSHGVERALLLDGQLNLVDDMLHYFDRTSMQHSLEVRVPYLDHRLVEFCATVPTKLKLSRGSTKRILRSVARDFVPDFVIDRPKVGFFSGAVHQWFENQATSAIDDILLDPGAAYTEFIDRAEVARLARAGNSYRTTKLLLAILMLELWLQSYVKRAVEAQPLTRTVAV